MRKCHIPLKNRLKIKEKIVDDREQQLSRITKKEGSQSETPRQPPISFIRRIYRSILCPSLELYSIISNLFSPQLLTKS